MRNEDEEKKKKDILAKINQFTQLMEEISNELVSIYNDEKEEYYHEVIMKMLESLDSAQQTVRKAYNIALGRKFSQNQ